MKWHRRHISELGGTIQTERFYLKSVGTLRALVLNHKINDDPEILAQYKNTVTKLSWLKWYRAIERPNGRSRLTYEIITKSDGKSIGFHTIRLTPYRSATIGIVILAKEYWGKGVTPEVRKVLLPLFADKAGVERFCAHVATRNFASIYNHQKLNFKQVGIMHQVKFDSARNEPIDFFMFELLKKDFPDYFAGPET